MTVQATGWAAIWTASMLLFGSCAGSSRDRSDGPSPVSQGKTWPQFRGTGGLGRAQADVRFPLDWDGRDGRNILWKATPAARGNSSPIVWRERLFLTGDANGEGRIVCLSCATGVAVWEVAVVPADLLPDILRRAEGHSPLGADDLARDHVTIFAALTVEPMRLWSLEQMRFAVVTPAHASSSRHEGRLATRR